jgi:predicted methyltransferase
MFAVVDHHAEAGSGSRDVQSLHRVDMDLVLSEVLAAGFELEDSSDLLRHPGDSRTSNVFDPDIRGRTDRFILRFRKPEEGGR